MRFNKLIHPEILLDKRGSPFGRLFYKKIMAGIDYDDHHFYMNGKFNLPLGENDRRYLNLMKVFKQKNGQVYHVNKDFLEALSKVDLAMPVDLLPNELIAYVSFAHHTLRDEKDWIQGGYVYIGKGYGATAGKRVLWVAFLSDYVDEDSNTYVGTVYAPLENKTIEEILAGFEIKDELGGLITAETPSDDTRKKRNVVIRALVNAVIYANCDNVIKLKVPASQDLSNSKWSAFKSKHGVGNECTLPVTFLNWSYKREREYAVGSSWVESFPRWQRCGPALSRVKFIFVEGFERKYKQKESNV